MGHKGKKCRDGWTSRTCAPPGQKLSKSENIFTAKSADPNTPLFEISDGDDVICEDNPAVTQAKANLAVAECIQQERAEQRRLEREERKVRAEAERLKKKLRRQRGSRGSLRRWSWRG